MIKQRVSNAQVSGTVNVQCQTRQEGLQLIGEPQIHPIVENNICQPEPRLYPSISAKQNKITLSYVTKKKYIHIINNLYY